MSTFVTYSGVTLQMCQVLLYERTHNWDGPHYLHTKHRLRVQGVYNPQATAYTENGDGTASPGSGGNWGPTPNAGPPQLPAQTDAAIRFILAQPRKQLLFQIGEHMVLASPLFNTAANGFYTSDAANGPIPVVHSVEENLGERTWLVDFEVETDVLELPSDVAATTVLSHRWQASEQIPLPNYLSRRSVEGHVVLRGDVMRSLNRIPDDFRRAIIHPCPVGYQREDIQVRADDGQTTLHYSFADQQLPINYGASVATAEVSKIEAFQTSDVGRPGVDEVIIGMARGALNAAGTFSGVVGSANPFVTALGLGLTAAAVGAGVAIGVYNLIPQKRHLLIVRVWGNRRAHRKVLEKVGFDIAYARLLQSGGPDPRTTWRGGVHAQVVHDLMGKFVEVQLQYRQGIDRIGVPANAFNDIASVGTSVASTIAQFNNVANTIQAGLQQLGTFPWHSLTPADADYIPPYLTDTASANPTLPLDGNTRGSVPLAVLAQVLHDAGTVPPAVTAPTNLNQRVPGSLAAMS